MLHGHCHVYARLNVFYDIKESHQVGVHTVQQATACYAIWDKLIDGKGYFVQSVQVNTLPIKPISRFSTLLTFFHIEQLIASTVIHRKIHATPPG